MFRFSEKYVPSDDLLKHLAAKMLWEDQAIDPSGDSSIPAGYTILGQFITHDLSFGLAPLDGLPDDQTGNPSYRTPALDLDSVYGTSPDLKIEARRDASTGKMVHRKSRDGVEPDDLWRFIDEKKPGDPPDEHDHRAIIGDGRNDDNVLISQLHLAFLKLHNQFVDDASKSDLSPDERFEWARQLCRWLFQWVVIDDFLPRIVGQKMVDKILIWDDEGYPHPDLEFYPGPNMKPRAIPVEFSAAAFRFGHSMIRSEYRVNAAGTAYPLFGSPEGGGRHLGGRRRLPAALVVDWARFFDLPEPSGLANDRKLSRNVTRKIDISLNELLATLPKGSIPDNDTGTRSLALRDLRRSVELDLPAGRQVAEEIARRVGGFAPLSNEELGLPELAPEEDVPLWYYILKEAEITPNCKGICGEQLGPVGGRIVAEVILGLLMYDGNSYLNNMSAFTDKTGLKHQRSRFTMADLLELAGVTEHTA